MANFNLANLTSGSTWCGQASAVASSSTTSQPIISLIPPVNLTVGSFVQFNLSTGCNGTTSGFQITLQSSTDNVTWSSLAKACNPFSSSCSPFATLGDSIYDAAAYGNGWHRVSVSVKNAFYGYIRVVGLTPGKQFAIGYLGVGLTCPSACNNRGTCFSSSCGCDAGSSGSACNSTSTTIPKSFSETFDPVMLGNWATVSGCSPATSSCGVLAAGNSMFCNQAGMRKLETIDFNTTLATAMSFYIQMGTVYGTSCSGPASSNLGVVAAYSTDGGFTYTLLRTVATTLSSPSLIVIALPLLAQTSSTRFAFWQPSNGGLNIDVWVSGRVLLGLLLPHSYYRISTTSTLAHPILHKHLSVRRSTIQSTTLHCLDCRRMESLMEVV